MIHLQENYIVAIVRRRLIGSGGGSFSEYPSREQQLRELLRGFRPDRISAVEHVAKTGYTYSWVVLKDQLCVAAGFENERDFVSKTAERRTDAAETDV